MCSSDLDAAALHSAQVVDLHAQASVRLTHLLHQGEEASAVAREPKRTPAPLEQRQLPVALEVATMRLTPDCEYERLAAALVKLPCL